MGQAEQLYVQQENTNFEDAHRNLIDVISEIKRRLKITVIGVTP